MTPQLKDIEFDNDDSNLFQIADLRLKADALKHSVLPKLHVVVNECIATIRDVYGAEALEHCGVSQSPNFRQKRTTELKTDYSLAYVALAGKRLKDKWHGLTREEGQPAQIHPALYAIYLDENGMSVYLGNMGNVGVKGIDAQFYQKVFDFLLEYESPIYALRDYARMSQRSFHRGENGPIAGLKDTFNSMIRNKDFDFGLFSEVKPYPVSLENLRRVVTEYVCLYPIFDSYIQIGLGQKPRFSELIKSLNHRLSEIDEDSKQQRGHAPSQTQNTRVDAKASEMAEKKIKVMPGIRWQVFARDNWKCVACGRTAQDGIILQVDHILPRSKGGRNALDNYQTLCNECNSGKSNRDKTDLREKHKANTG